MHRHLLQNVMNALNLGCFSSVYCEFLVSRLKLSRHICISYINAATPYTGNQSRPTSSVSLQLLQSASVSCQLLPCSHTPSQGGGTFRLVILQFVMRRRRRRSSPNGHHFSGCSRLQVSVAISRRGRTVTGYQSPGLDCDRLPGGCLSCRAGAHLSEIRIRTAHLPL